MPQSPSRKLLMYSAGYGAFSVALVPFGFAIAHGSVFIAVLFALLLAPVFLVGAIAGVGEEWPLPATCAYVFIVQSVAAYLVLSIVGLIKRDTERIK